MKIVQIDEIPPTREGYSLPFKDEEIKIFKRYNGPLEHSQLEDLI